MAFLQDPLKPGTFRAISTYFGALVGSGPYKGTPHNGIDLPASQGTAVYAANAGVVTRVDMKDAGGGLIVEVYNKATGIKTQYAHLSAADVKVGQQVTQGQQIAAVGDSGSATGYHLHFGVAQCAVGSSAPTSCAWRNPLSYLDLFGPQGTYSGIASGVQATLANATDPASINSGWWGSFSADANAFMKDHPGATWRDFAANKFHDFHWMPAWTADDILKATDKLGITDKPVQSGDVTRVALAALQLGAGSNPISATGDALGTIAQGFGFLLDPVNWLRIFALIAGGALIVVGGRWVYQAT